MSSVERLFDEFGHFGRFQACVYFAAVFQSIACGIHYLASVFLASTPKFVCTAPGNITSVLYGNYSGAALDDIWEYWSAEKSYVLVETANGEQWELAQCDRAKRTSDADFVYEFSGNKTVYSCSGSYIYDQSEVQQSIVTEWDLVCEKEWLAKLSQPTFMLGVLIGALIFGDIADRVGRRPVLMFTSLCQFGFGIIVAFTFNYYFFVVIRFILAMVSSGYLVVCFVYVTEFTGNKVRTWTSMHVHAAFAVGVMVVALVGYLVRVWWIYQIVLSLSTLPFLFICWKLPETPFYLLAKGKYQETQDLLDTITWVNGINRSCKVSDLLESDGETMLERNEVTKQKRLSILDLFGSLKMAGRSITVWLVWFIGSLGYYVFSLGSVNLGGNQFVNLFLAGAVELPSYIVACFAMDRLGRRNTLAPSLLLSGTACALIIVVPKDIGVLVIILSMTGKFAIAIAFGLIYLYTCELYPTIVRSLAVGSGSMMCRIGSVVAPFCVYLSSVWTFLPQLIVGILAFAIGLLTLMLPETLGNPLTTTFEEAAALGSKVTKTDRQVTGDLGEKMEMDYNALNMVKADDLHV
uniref:Solute carrier family 22 member 16 n=1 Tax=Lepisosteus oculatus TaxID=7918 RepID=W5NKN5_LEPOC|nr:PREDICTED: solute carrier family 22 member 16 [Lepisosteus oculatus]